MIGPQPLAADLLDNTKDTMVSRCYASRKVMLHDWFAAAWTPTEPITFYQTCQHRPDQQVHVAQHTFKAVKLQCSPLYIAPRIRRQLFPLFHAQLRQIPAPQPLISIPALGK